LLPILDSEFDGERQNALEVLRRYLGNSGGSFGAMAADYRTLIVENSVLRGENEALAGHCEAMVRTVLFWWLVSVMLIHAGSEP
jgi:hypothetical protein